MIIKTEVIVTLLTGKLVNKLWCVHAIGYYSSSQRNHGNLGYIFIFNMQGAE